MPPLMLRMTTYALALLFLFAGLGCSSPTPASSQREVTFVLVRHAEKSGSEKASDLTEAGHARAARLADMLQDIPLSAVYSSDFVRTRHTVLPCAERQGLEIRPYGIKDIPAFAQSLRETHREGAVLVSGHSDTTPKLANALLGEERYAVIRDSDYTHLLMITCREDGPCRSLLLHY